MPKSTLCFVALIALGVLTGDMHADDKALVGKDIQGPVRRLEISPDARWLVTAGTEGRLNLFDLQGKEPESSPLELKGHRKEIRALAFSGDNRWLATADDDGSIRLWDLKASEPQKAPVVLREHRNAVVRLAVSADGNWLASCDTRGQIYLCDLSKPKVGRGVNLDNPWLSSPGDDSSLVFSPDGRWLFTATNDTNRYQYRAYLFDLKKPRPEKAFFRLNANVNAFRSPVFSANGKRLVTVNGDNAIRIWDLTADDPSQSAVRAVRYTEALAIVITPDDASFVCVHPEGPRSFDMTGKAGATMKRENPLVRAAISSDRRWLGATTKNGTAEVRALDPAKMSTTLLEGPTDRARATAVAFSPRGRWLCTGSADGIVRLHEIGKEGPAARASMILKCQGPLKTIQVSPDESWLIALTTEGTASLFRLKPKGE